MTKIFIDNEDESKITQIAWMNDDGGEEYIEDCVLTIRFVDDCGDYAVIKKDVPKLLKALEKAKELGWWTDES